MANVFSVLIPCMCLMFCSPCVVIYPYNKSQKDAPFLLNLFQ